jgi:DUF4097 and DUF4098 domain-containing protein YvlB
MNKNLNVLITLLGIVWILAPVVSAQAEKPIDTITVPLSNPGKPGWVNARVMFGSITVEGYSGREVVVEARVRGKVIDEDENETDERVRHELREARRERRNREKEEEKKTRDITGLKLIPATGSGLTIEEEDNQVSIRVESWKQTIDLHIRVPVNTSLKLKCHNNGKIEVKGVNGELEVNNLNGPIRLAQVGGTVLAHTLNGDVEATFTRVNPAKPMSFSTMNGDIDVTLPAGIKNTVKMDSKHGDIYSDFNIVLVKNPTRKKESKPGAGGKYRIEITRGVFGKINGGGPEINFKTFNGDIYIRSK